MKVLRNLLGGLLILLLVLVVAAYFLPRGYRIERTVEIAAPPGQVFEWVGNLEKWRAWGVWYERDPAMAVTVSTDPGPAEAGGWVSWQSETQGNGTARLVKAEPPWSAVYDLSFEGFDMTSRGSFRLEPTDAGVRVIWTDSGDLGLNPVYRWFGLMLDQMVGADFEAGLARLKALVENGETGDGGEAET
jgi:uncharacterized protein YndB with AHSA1/START domain